MFYKDKDNRLYHNPNAHLILKKSLIEITKQEFNNAVTAQKEISIEVAKKKGLDAVKSTHARLLNEMTGYETTEERDTWRSQLAWAKAYKTGDESSKAHLVDLLRQEEVGLLGEGGALLELCDKILAKAAHVGDIIGRVGGLRRVARYEIEAAETLDQVKDAIKKFEEEGAKL